MPEYKAPGVFIEETSHRPKSIEGVSTDIAGFIGPARYGPLDLNSELITSLIDFERCYGGGERLEFSGGNNSQENFLWHAVRAFFAEGGKRLYVSRTYKPAAAASGTTPFPGYATGGLPEALPVVQIRARYPGRAGNLRATFTLSRGPNVLFQDPGSATNSVRALQDRDVVLFRNIGVAPAGGAYYIALHDGASPGTWQFSQSGSALDASNLRLENLGPAAGGEIHVVTLSVTIAPLSAGGQPCAETGLPLEPKHLNAGQPDSVFACFKPTPAGPKREPDLPIVLTVDSTASGLTVLQALFESYTGNVPAQGAPDPGLAANLTNPASDASRRQVVVNLLGGDDGVRPDAAAFAGSCDAATGERTGLAQFEAIEEISIVAAPGSTFGYADTVYGPQARGIVKLLISHAERMRYRIAVLDSGDDQSVSEVRAMRSEFNSTHAALYYPWVRVIDPLTHQEISLPPSGFVCGIYARSDIERGVWKAPANEVVTLAVGFEKLLNTAEQDVLNPEGINCFRFFAGRGCRLWGARTISSDPEWKYVNLRRYFAYLERSIEKGTQWAVFEPNDERLWSNVRLTIEDFLYKEWQSGALLGDKSAKAYFVSCDRSTMSQNDLDNGWFICVIGVAAIKPAEFLIFKIGQKTADARG